MQNTNWQQAIRYLSIFNHNPNYNDLGQRRFLGSLWSSPLPPLGSIHYPSMQWVVFCCCFMAKRFSTILRCWLVDMEIVGLMVQRQRRWHPKCVKCVVWFMQSVAWFVCSPSTFRVYLQENMRKINDDVSSQGTQQLELDDGGQIRNQYLANFQWGIFSPVRNIGRYHSSPPPEFLHRWIVN